MVNSKTYTIVLASMLVFICKPCYAPTDWVVNMMDYCNGMVKDASAVQEEYAGYANSYVQGKVGELGDVNVVKKKTEKAKSLKDKADKYKKKAEKVKALAAKAKEKKAALEAEAKKLQEKADKVKAQYDKAKAKVDKAKAKVDKAKAKIDEAKAKVNEVKDKVNEVKDKVNEAKDQYNEIKDQVNEGIETAKGLKDAAGGAIDAAKEKAGLEAAAPEAEPAAETVAEPEAEPAAETAPVEKVSLPAPANALLSMQALTADEAAITTDVALQALPTEQPMAATLSADEVLKLSEMPDNQVAATAAAVSEFNMEEQLLMSDQLKAKERGQKALLSNEELQGRLKAGDDAKLESLRQSRRKSFAVKGAENE